jgi:hypothetical protein
MKLMKVTDYFFTTFQNFLTFNQVFGDVWINSRSGSCTRLVNNANNVSIQDTTSCSDTLKYLCVKSGEMIICLTGNNKFNLSLVP